MDSKFIVDFSDDCIVQHSNNIKVFKFKSVRRKRSALAVPPPIEVQPAKPTSKQTLRGLGLKPVEVQFFLDLFKDD